MEALANDCGRSRLSTFADALLRNTLASGLPSLNQHVPAFRKARTDRDDDPELPGVGQIERKLVRSECCGFSPLEEIVIEAER